MTDREQVQTVVVEGALIKEQGVTFGIVIVKHGAMEPSVRQRTLAWASPLFPGHPVVLMSQDSSGTPSYFGRTDIVTFLSRLPLSSIPWKRYTLN